MQTAFTLLEACGKVVIAAIHGYCIGSGLELVCACDVRMCTTDTQFTLKEVDLGIVADLGGLQRLGKCVGNQGWVRDVCYSGRVFGGMEAEKQGFVKQVFDDQNAMMGIHIPFIDYMIEQAFKYAHMISNKDPNVLMGIK